MDDQDPLDSIMSNRILIMDADQAYMETLAGKLRSLGYQNLYLENNALEAAVAFEKGEAFDVYAGYGWSGPAGSYKKHQPEH